MIYYFFFFGICFLINSLKKEDNKISVFFVVSLYLFLCFGYMTGSDWRAYEVDYMSGSFERAEWLGEVGYVLVSKTFSFFISDFWLYSGLMKCFHLFSLILFISLFTKNVYATIALGFSGSLLFMLIDCPMRFMMAMTIVYLGMYFLLKSKRRIHQFLAIGLILMSFYMHNVALVVIAILLLGFLAKLVVKVKPLFVFVAFIAMIFIVGSVGLFDFLFATVVPILDADRFDNYTGAELNSIYTLGTVKTAFLLIITLLFKDRIIESGKYGYLIYFYSLLFYLFYPLTARVVTLFRINIINGIFADISLVYVLFCAYRRNHFLSIACKVIIILSTVYVLYDNCRERFDLTPYSNSIPYIVSGKHLPYSYRDTYNVFNHDREYLF